MKDSQWNTILAAAQCQELDAIPTGLIVDSPWIPGYCNVSTIDYYSDPAVWMDCYKKIKSDFPELIFLPDYWVEMGMAAEPSSFGCKPLFYHNQPVMIRHLIEDADEIEKLLELEIPDPQKDGLMPLAINYYKNLQKKLAGTDEKIRIAASRGPLNIATFLMSVPEFLMAIKDYDEEAHRLLDMTTELVIRWLKAQIAVLPDVEGILVLDDICGFLSKDDYLEFAQPYLKRIYDSFSVPVKMFHNDNFGNQYTTFPYIADLGINIFNFSYQADIRIARKELGDKVCILGNIAPLDILTRSDPETIKAETLRLLNEYDSAKGIIFSAGGGASPGMPEENCRAMLDAVRMWNEKHLDT